MKKLLLLFLVFGIHKSFAQNIDGTKGIQGKDKPNSPTEQKGGSNIINVDPFTGVGNVNIPIYDYTVDGLNLGVSLSYNTKGIKVDDIASSVGLGWELNTGGSIERVTQGMEDEVGLAPVPVTGTKYGGAWTDAPYYTNISTRNDKQHDYFIANIGGRTIQFAMDKLNYGVVSTYPKSEIRIQASVTGSLYNYVGSNRDFQSIVCNSVGEVENNHVLNFTIIDEKGNKFIFERGDYNTVHYDVPDAVPGTYYVPTRWVLTKVVTYTGAEVNYTYQTTSVLYVQSVNEQVLEIFDANDPDKGVQTPEINNEYFNGKHAHITGISYPNGVNISFDVSSSATNARCDVPGNYVLNNIVINSSYDNNVTNTIKYKFNHAYFHTPESGNNNTELAYGGSCQNLYATADALRLKLSSIDKIGTDNVTSERYYTFDYNSSPLPVRLAKCRDYYGYYNGASTTPLYANNINWYLSIPLHTATITPGYNVITYGTSRASDATSSLTYIKACLLSKITNGNAGEVEISYVKPTLDANSQYQYNGGFCGVGEDELTGNSKYTVDPALEATTETDGLVIDKLTMKDGFSSDNDVIIKYDYAGGRRFYMGGYTWYPVRLTSDHSSILQLRYCNYFLAPQDYFNGSNHGYEWVTVSKFNKNTNERLSKVLYTYSNLIMPPNFTDMYDPSFTPTSTYKTSRLTLKTGLLYHTAYRDNIWKDAMGLVLQETNYDQADNVTSMTQYRYDVNYVDPPNEIHSTTFACENVYNSGRWFAYKIPCPSCPSTANGWQEQYVLNDGGHVFDNGGHHRMTKSIHNIYSGGVQATIEHNYIYDYADNLKSDTWIDSKGDTYRKEYIYSSDINNLTNCNDDLIQYQLGERLLKINPSNSTYDRLISHNLVRPYITSTSPLYYANTTAKLICAVRFPTIFTSAFNEPVTVAPAITDENNAVIYNSINATQSTLRKLKEYTLYDDKNNILEVKYDDKDIYSSYVWDTRIGQKIAEISNARHADVAYSSFEGLADPNVSVYGHGNWVMDPAHVTLTSGTNMGSAITGKYCYNLDYTDAGSILHKTLAAGKEYILTFWADEEPVVKLDNTIITTSLQLTNNAGWKLYTAYITTGSTDGNLTINELEPPTSGGGGSSTMRNAGYIDELRLYPSNASMTTYTYEPLLGISSMCDSRNNIIYYDYDAMGRLQHTRDFDGNIVQKNVYVNQGPNN